MKNRRPNTDHTQRPPVHPPVTPVFRSPKSASRFAADLAEVREAITFHGQQAAGARQSAEEQVQHVQSREELIAEKEREIEEFRAQKEREIASLRAEIERYNAAAKDFARQAEMHIGEQQAAELEKSDIEDVLSTYAPGVLDQLNGTPPPAPPSTTAPGGTGGYPAAGNGTGPQQVPAQRTEGR
ncbi:hypothetical protein [Actinomadura geliboluensis]|uniref:hypothetical protein n=1 Tax=Actinomadura geliboluensis TaxID=882440 RepID=UPI0036995699